MLNYHLTHGSGWQMALPAQTNWTVNDSNRAATASRKGIDRFVGGIMKFQAVAKNTQRATRGDAV